MIFVALLPLLVLFFCFPQKVHSLENVSTFVLVIHPASLHDLDHSAFNIAASAVPLINIGNRLIHKHSCNNFVILSFIKWPQPGKQAVDIVTKTPNVVLTCQFSFSVLFWGPILRSRGRRCEPAINTPQNPN